MNDELKYSGLVNTQARRIAAKLAVPGNTLFYIDKQIEDYIKKMDCTPAFFNYKGFPASSCLSVNDIAVHGVPSDYRLQPEDILKIDVGVTYGNFVTDAATTVIVESDKKTKKSSSRKLLQYCNMQLLNAGLCAVKDGVSLNKITTAIESQRDKINDSLGLIKSKKRLCIIESLCGHYIGSSLHVEPCVLSAFHKSEKIKKYQMMEYENYTLREGDTLCIEPVVTWGNGEILVSDNDNWSVFTADGSDASHFEACILVTKEGFEIIS
jgi:methionyl aminopeptidase